MNMYNFTRKFARNFNKFKHINIGKSLLTASAITTVGTTMNIDYDSLKSTKRTDNNEIVSDNDNLSINKPLRNGWILNESTFDFDANNHYYAKVLNAELHPLVSYFLSLSAERIAHRYCHLHPTIDKNSLCKLLHTKPLYLRWSGADLFVTTNQYGIRKLTVIETNTCPSGQKSMPRTDEELNDGYGYKKLISTTFKPMLNKVDPSLFSAKLGVIYDKNSMEAKGYAQSISRVFGEDVYVAEFYNDDPNPPVKFDNDGIMYIRIIKNEEENDGNIEYEWIPIRAAFRYVTQNPWDRIPVNTKTLILNPIIGCLAGGRNKNLAAKAYEIFNANLQTKSGLSGLKLNTPQTIKDVPFDAIPFMIKKFGGKGVIKSPYGNAGVDVFTITNDKELSEFMNNFGQKENDEMGRGYGEKFIVQSLIGNANWSSSTISGTHYHVGTVPDKNGKFYAADIRLMIHYDGNAWKPLCIYSRRAKEPLSKDLTDDVSSWDILGTNLSVKVSENNWQTDTNRLLLMDTRAFNRLGIGLDDLINAYVQTVLATISIDDLCKVLMNNNDNDNDIAGTFDFKLFSTLNDDNDILEDIAKCNNFSNPK